MVRLAQVDVWPMSGWPTALWMSADGTESTDVDAFARASRSPSEILSRAIRERNIEAEHSEVRLFPFSGTTDEIGVSVIAERFDGFDSGHIRVPPGFFELADDVRMQSAGESLVLAVIELARVRGRDLEALRGAADEMRANGYRYSWSGAWKSNRSRTRRTRLTGAIEPDGFGRLVAEISDGAEVWSSQPVQGWTTREGFERAAASLRWETGSVVTFATGEWLPRQARVDLESRTTSLDRPAEPPTRFTGAVRVRPRIVFIPPPAMTVEVGFGYGTPDQITGEVVEYSERMNDLLEFVRTNGGWMRWWESLENIDSVSITVLMDDDRPSVVMRRSGRRIGLTIRRGPGNLSDRASESAAEDLRRALDKVADKYATRTHPDLPV